MNNEDVLIQLRAWRDEFAKSHAYDIHAMAAAMRELDSGNVVHGVPRRPVLTIKPDEVPQSLTAASSVSTKSNLIEPASMSE